MGEIVWIDAVKESDNSKRLGVDIAQGGKNYSVWVIRQGKHAFIKEKNRDPDLMSQVGKTKRIMEEEGIEPENVFIDEVGVGAGVVARLKEQDLRVNAIKGGAQAQDSEHFVNVRAEAYWRLMRWVKDGGALEKDDDWYQLCNIKYKEDSSSRIKMMSKDEMRRQGIESPDVADALMLTFAAREVSGKITAKIL